MVQLTKRMFKFMPKVFYEIDQWVFIKVLMTFLRYFFWQGCLY